LSFVYLDTSTVIPNLLNTSTYDKNDSIILVSKSTVPVLETNAKMNDFTSITVLLFKDEKISELWGIDNNEVPHLLKISDFDVDMNVPIGKFEVLNDQNNYRIKFPNEIYQRKLRKSTKKWEKDAINFNNMIGLENILKPFDIGSQMINLLISPNDLRKNNGIIEPCIHCPHWMPEIYSSIESEIKLFDNQTIIYPIQKKILDRNRIHS